MTRFVVLCALAALAVAQDGYDYQTPNTGYDYKEPANPEGDGNTPDGSVIKPEGDSEDHHHGGSSDPLQWLRESVPGEPGEDYPIFDVAPETGFTCEGKVAGYYADVEAGCQPFHVCHPIPNGEAMQMTFLCPKGTIFKQESFACQWWSDVDCSASEQFYSKNEEIGVVPESAASNNQGSVVGAPQQPGQAQPQQPQGTYGQPQTQTQRPRPQPQTQRPRPQPQEPQSTYQQPPTQTQRPRPQPQRPQNTYQQPQTQTQRPRPQSARPQPQRPRPQVQRPQNTYQQPQVQRPRPQTQSVKPVPNQYIPPTTTTTTTTVTPPPGLYNLPRN